MAIDKDLFDRTAAALKVMGKKITAKKNDARTELLCVWIPHKSRFATACDGRVLACLDLAYYQDLTDDGNLKELAFYADMQVLQYCNGRALITASKKEKFIQRFGHGWTITPEFSDLEDTRIPYPEWRNIIPQYDLMKNASTTGAMFAPGKLMVLEQVKDALGVAFEYCNSISCNLYGIDNKSAHVAICTGLLMAAFPEYNSEADYSVLPEKINFEHFLVKNSKDSKPHENKQE